MIKKSEYIHTEDQLQKREVNDFFSTKSDQMTRVGSRDWHYAGLIILLSKVVI